MKNEFYKILIYKIDVQTIVTINDGPYTVKPRILYCSKFTAYWFFLWALKFLNFERVRYGIPFTENHTTHGTKDIVGDIVVCGVKLYRAHERERLRRLPLIVVSYIHRPWRRWWLHTISRGRRILPLHKQSIKKKKKRERKMFKLHSSFRV